jgi:hypothetical protein
MPVSGVATVDYSNYLEQQNQWVTSLVKVARGAEPQQAKELAEIVVQSLHRMLDMTWTHSPCFHLPVREPEAFIEPPEERLFLVKRFN